MSVSENDKLAMETLRITCTVHNIYLWIGTNDINYEIALIAPLSPVLH